MSADPVVSDPTERAAPNGPPAAAVRGEYWIKAVDQLLARVDGWLGRALPADLNPLAQSGRAANFTLLVAVVSGVWMLLWYSPSLVQAYPSLAAIAGRTLGGWVRAVHRYSSDLVMLLLFIHAGRMFFARKFAGPRWLPWISGIGLVALVWFIGWTGYWLVWDQPAKDVAISSMRLVDSIPIFGEPIGRLYVSDRTVPSLLFFVVFFLHMLLPLGIAVGLAVHLIRISRIRLLPAWPLSIALLVGLAVAALAIPAPLDAPAKMAEKPDHLTLDLWYLGPLTLALRFQSAGLWLALFGTCAVGASLPWILGRRRTPATFQAEVEPSRCHACTQCKQDCPFDAITMVARTDGKRFASQAFVDPARCVGCGVCAGSCDSEGISMLWFDTRREEARIVTEVGAELSSKRECWVAFVAADIDGGATPLSALRWRERVPGFHVQVIPTASWLRPSLVERLLKSGVSGVLVVRDARAEAAARDGNQWVLARLAGERGPVYRAERAGDSAGRWRVVDFDPSNPAALRRIAEEFRTSETAAQKEPGTRGRRGLAYVALLAVALALVTVAVIPSRWQLENPSPAAPEFVFSFKALGEISASHNDAAADLNKPVHMRGHSTTKPRRADVRVRIDIDGAVEERSYRAKGISNDGPAIGAWHLSLAPGLREITVQVWLAPDREPLRWSGTLQAQERRLHVLAYEAGTGFVLE